MPASFNTIALPETRLELEQLIEAAISRLDDFDGDPDLEPSLGAPEARRADWWNNADTQETWAGGSDDGRELDDDFEPESEA